MYIGIAAIFHNSVPGISTYLTKNGINSIGTLKWSYWWYIFLWKHVLRYWWLKFTSYIDKVILGGLWVVRERNMCWHQRSVGTWRGKRLSSTNRAWKLFRKHILTYVEKLLLTLWEMNIDTLRNMRWHQIFVGTRRRRNCLPKFWGCWLF